MTPRPAAGDVARFVAGLMASCVLLALGTLLVLAAVPLAAPGWTSTVVGSGSMSPALLTGDIVIVEERRGDAGLAAPAVLLAERPGDLPLLHRVLGQEPGRGYRTKGDANARPDGTLVPADTVIGVGRVLVPWVGFPALWVRAGNLPALTVSLLTLVALAHASKYGWEPQYDPWRARSAASPA